MRTAISERVQKHRAALRASGLRPIQIWVPDTRAQGFAQECRRQSLLASVVDNDDKNFTAIMNEALADIDGWEA